MDIKMKEEWEGLIQSLFFTDRSNVSIKYYQRCDTPFLKEESILATSPFLWEKSAPPHFGEN